MIDGRPSDTALQVAAARAAHLRFDPAPHLLEDVHAGALLGPDFEDMTLGYRDASLWLLVENRIFIPLRGRYVEDCLREAHARGVRQFVILGAGLDSFAFRQPSDLPGLHVFEIDHPSTQGWKRARLEELGWAIPKNTRYVPCDFEKQTAAQALLQSEFDANQPAVVSWMGVVYYLEKETVDAGLRDLAELLAPGSDVAFDVMRPWEELPDRYQEMRELMAKYLSKAGEPHVNRYRKDEIAETVRAAGFTEARIEERETLEARYVSPIETKIPLSHRFRLVTARLT